MECFIEISEPVIDVKFQLKKNSQKYLIEYILYYSELDSRSLADILEVNPLLLSDVLSGNEYLNKDTFMKLHEYFLILISG